MAGRTSEPSPRSAELVVAMRIALNHASKSMLGSLEDGT